MHLLLLCGICDFPCHQLLGVSFIVRWLWDFFKGCDGFSVYYAHKRQKALHNLTNVELSNSKRPFTLSWLEAKPMVTLCTGVCACVCVCVCACVRVRACVHVCVCACGVEWGTEWDKWCIIKLCIVVMSHVECFEPQTCIIEGFGALKNMFLLSTVFTGLLMHSYRASGSCLWLCVCIFHGLESLI